MIDKQIYSAKTLRIYNRLIELKEEINNDKYLDKNKNVYKSKLRELTHNWSNHCVSKKLEHSDLNTEVKLFIDEVNNKLDGQSIILSDELIEDGLQIFKSITYIEDAIAELNSFIEFELVKTIDTLERLRLKAEKNVSMKTIQDLRSKYLVKEDVKLMSELCSHNILRARTLEAKFNKIIDGVEILEGIEKI